MQYENMRKGRFVSRPNRFIAIIDFDGMEERVHVKNTGRCRELLQPGAEVWCAESDNRSRKTRFDLISVRKGSYMINMDSQAPNAAVTEWLLGGGLGAETVKPEQKYGSSRFDFYLERRGEDGVLRPMYLEVKGVTLETDGVCRFPDAPTERGTKHLHELIAARQAGFDAGVLFVIQMRPVKELRPHDETDPAFGRALREAAAAGVEILARDCSCTESTMVIGEPIPVILQAEAEAENAFRRSSSEPAAEGRTLPERL